MTPRLIMIALASLSLTGCVAALPMVAQLAANPNSMTQLCSLTKMPGQTSSFCDRLPFGSSSQASANVPTGKTVNTAER
jgi:hypothetical protein